MIPYRPETSPMRGDEQETLAGILEDNNATSPYSRLRAANAILNAGFARRVPVRVTRLQLWRYFMESVLLAYCTGVVYGTGRMFVYGALMALTIGALLTWIGGLIINASIDKEARAS